MQDQWSYTISPLLVNKIREENTYVAITSKTQNDKREEKKEKKIEKNKSQNEDELAEKKIKNQEDWSSKN